MNNPSLPLVEQKALAQMQAKASFTALDISNALKTERYPVTHTQVAEVVRDIFTSGAMDLYQYRRRLIDVVTKNGTQNTQAFLYLHDEHRAQEYQARAQSALPAVPPDQAQALPARRVTPLAQPTHRPAPARSARSQPGARRDGALAVSRTWVLQMGWQPGDLLGLTAQDGIVILGTVQGPAQILVRVWAGERVRISRHRLASLNLCAAQVHVSKGTHGLQLG